MYERLPFAHAPRDCSAWIRILARYREPRCTRSILEIMITAVPLVLLWILMWKLLSLNY
jgi:acyl-lipid omega-6 desaturase (Delta-12 desaturase)